MNPSHNFHLVSSPIWFITAELTKNNGDLTTAACMTIFAMSSVAALLGIFQRKKV